MSGERWYFALLGLESQLEQFEFEPAARLVRVVEPPTDAELAAALREPRLFAALGRYMQAMRYELVVDRKLGATLQAASNLAVLIVAALRIRTGGELLLPAFADHSWSTIAAIIDGRCTAGLLEDVVQFRRPGEPTLVTGAELEWVWPRLPGLADLLATPRLRLALDALTTHHQEANPRLAAVKLWAGIEAMMACDGERRGRLAGRLAAVLEPRGPGRRELYERIRELDAMRARVLLSELLSPQDIGGHLREVGALLARLLRTIVDAGHLPTSAALDQALFC